MTLLVAAGAGYLAGRLLWLLARPAFAAPAFLRDNYRGRRIPTAAGVLIPVAVLLVEAGRVVAAAAGVGDDGLPVASRVLVAVAAAGFGLLGAVDDLGGRATDARGFGGHAAALGGGRLTTGGLKLVGGAALAIVACAPVSGGSLTGLLRDAALVALAANLGNLFDRAPGRSIKVAALALAVLAAAVSRTGGTDPLVAVAVAVGAGLALFLDDLHERLMLGDAGANVLGAVVGLGAVLALSPGLRWGVLAALAALNLLSEAVSFSRVIAAVAPLRALDRWGRRP